MDATLWCNVYTGSDLTYNKLVNGIDEGGHLPGITVLCLIITILKSLTKPSLTKIVAAHKQPFDSAEKEPPLVYEERNQCNASNCTYIHSYVDL